MSLGLGQTIAGYGLSSETRTHGGSQMTVSYLCVGSGLLLGKMVSFLWDALECPSGQNDSGPLEDIVWPKITSYRYK